MGLDTTHGCWHGSYSNFSAWRSALGQASGCYFPGDYAHYGEAALYGDWTGIEPPADPLVYLIWHADHEGEIRPEQAAPLAMRLVELLPALDEGWHKRTKDFIAGLTLAVQRDERVEFH